MKMLVTLLTLGLTLSAFAQRDNNIDDLGVMGLNLDAAQTAAHDIHYPNYRMGGGNGAGRPLLDCLILDVRHSDAIVSLKKKLELAKKIMVVHGFNLDDEGGGNGFELTPEVKGNNVVYPMTTGTLYMTFLQAKTRDGRNLNEVLTESLPPVRPGNSLTVPTGLVYVRDCRF